VNEKLKGHFNQLKGELKRKWGKFISDPALRAEGDLDVLIGKIQVQASERPDEIKDLLDSQGL